MSDHGSFSYIPLSLLCENTREKNIFQRVIDNQKVKTIINGLLDEQKLKGFLYQTGVIQIAINNNKWYVLDGQHRLSAYECINGPNQIVIQKWYYENVEDIYKKFREINSNTPIDEYVINASINNSDFLEKEKYDKLINYIETYYIRLIKKTATPKWPNINNDHFRQVINYIPELKNSTIHNIIDKFEELNLKCGDNLSKGNKNERDWFNKPQTEPKLYINRYIIDLWNQLKLIK